MRNRHYFLQSLLLICGLCLATHILYAQDSNKVQPVHHLHSEKIKRPLPTDSGIFESQKESQETEKLTSHKLALPRKDTFLRKAPAGNKILGIRDPSHKRQPFSTLTGSPDSLLAKNTDSLKQKKAVINAFSPPSFTGHPFDNYRGFVNYLLIKNSIFKNNFQNQPDEITPLIREDNATRTGSGLFYTILGVLFLLGILRLSFTKYFTDLFRAFFNPTLSKRQLREQLSQNPAPAFMLNIFFAISAGLYVFLILRHFNYITTNRPLILIPLFILTFMVIYIVKFVFLRLSGWLFGYEEVVSGYIFNLYMVNKILGIGLLPFILVLAFCAPAIAEVALNISLIFIVLMFTYRYVRIFSSERNKIIFNKFHFFIYLCGFEIAPVLIIGKLVLIWLNGA